MIYFPFTGEAYQPKMGLKPLEPRAWIEPGEDFVASIARKKMLFREERDTVLRVEPGSDPFCLELHEMIKQHLLETEPEKYEVTVAGFHVVPTGDVFLDPTNALQALEQISLFTQEDWCVLSPDSPFALMAGAVCSPSRWSLADKMGKNPEGVHEHVPDFQKKLLAPTNSFMEKLKPQTPMWRLNWTIHDSDELFCPGPHPSKKILNAHNVVENCFLRVERQTLRRLPESRAIAFSIRTYLDPLSEVVKDLERKKLVYESLVGLPEETAVYRGMGPFLGALKEALRC